MVLFITGATHTGKTLLAQHFMERYHVPYLSIDHLKMGLIRSGHCPLTPESDDTQLTAFLWPIVREMAKTAIENRQDLVVEGCYVPFNYRTDFEESYLPHLRFLCLVFTEDYIRGHMGDILAHENDVEHRLTTFNRTEESLIAENTANLLQCQQHGCPFHLIDERYHIDISLLHHLWNCNEI